MRLAAIITSLFTLLVLGCGGDSGRDRLIKAMPAIVPDAQQVTAMFTGPNDQFQTVVRDFWPNALVADDGGYTPYYGASTRYLDSGGRITGYRVLYHIGPGGGLGRECCLDVAATVNLYGDANSASEYLRSRPSAATGDPIDAPTVGDESIAWPTKEWSGSSAGVGCPCDFRFRVGPYLATIALGQYGPPVFPTELDPEELVLAEGMVERMTAALSRR